MDLGLDDYGRLEYAEGRLVGLSPIASVGPIVPPLPASWREARSSKWPVFLHGLLVAHPDCVGCGRKAVTGHHEVPFHVDPSLELTAPNILLVCLPCHFVLCHCGDWRLVVPTARQRLTDNFVTVKQVEEARR